MQPHLLPAIIRSCVSHFIDEQVVAVVVVVVVVV